MKTITMKSQNGTTWAEQWESVEAFEANRKKINRGVELVAVGDSTPAEIARYKNENNAAEFYARYGSAGEF